MIGSLVKLYDEKAFSFKDSLKREGRCRLQVFRRDDFVLVVFTELKNNPGPSVTNAIESLIQIAYEAVPMFRSPWSKTEEKDDLIFLFLERYEDHPEYFDWVQLGSNGSPIWTRAKPEEIKTILPHLDM